METLYSSICVWVGRLSRGYSTHRNLLSVLILEKIATGFLIPFVDNVWYAPLRLECNPYITMSLRYVIECANLGSFCCIIKTNVLLRCAYHPLSQHLDPAGRKWFNRYLYLWAPASLRKLFLLWFVVVVLFVLLCFVLFCCLVLFSLFVWFFFHRNWPMFVAYFLDT